MDNDNIGRLYLLIYKLKVMDIIIDIINQTKNHVKK